MHQTIFVLATWSHVFCPSFWNFLMSAVTNG